MAYKRADSIKRRRRELVSFPEKDRYKSMRDRANKCGLAVMGFSEFVAWSRLQEKICVYCLMNNEAAKILFGRNLSIDRMDNLKGYLVENIALACFRCNTVKSSFLTYDQMMTVASMFLRPKAVVS